MTTETIDIDVPPTGDDELEGEVRELDPDEEHPHEPGAVVEYKPPRAVALTNQDRQIVYDMIVGQIPNVTTAEYEFFIRVSELRGLNPLFRESHLIKDNSGRINLQVGIDGFRKLAEQSGQYRGQGPAIFDGEYTGPVAAWAGKPAHCSVTVHRAGFEEPMIGECWLEEDGQLSGYDNKPNGQWGTRTRTMMAKVAEARAIRRAFPRSVAGLYTDDEIAAGASLAQLAGSPDETPPAAQIPAQTSDTPPSGTWTPPEPPEAPAPGFQGIVDAEPEDIRQVRIDWKEPPGLAGPHLKAEIKLKIKGRKHTVIALDEVAEAVSAGQIKPGEVVLVEGALYHEYEWEAGKPKAKQLRAPSAVYVMRRNEWIKLSPATPEMPLEDPPNRGPESSSESASSPSPSSTATTSATATTPPPSGSPSSRSASSAPSTATPSPASSSAASSSGPTDEPPDLAPTPIEWTSLEDNQTDDRVLVLHRPLELRQREGKTDKYAYIELADPESGEFFRAILGPEEEVDAQLRVDPGPEGAWLYVPGDAVRVVGTWRRAWLILTAVTTPPES